MKQERAMLNYNKYLKHWDFYENLVQNYFNQQSITKYGRKQHITIKNNHAKNIVNRKPPKMFETILNSGGVNYNDQFESQYKMYCLAKSMPSDASNFYTALLN